MIREKIVYEFVLAALDAFAAGMEKEAIALKAQEMAANGATLNDITEAVKGMRDQAIADAQKVVDGA